MGKGRLKLWGSNFLGGKYMLIFIGELIGTAMLILLGDGVVANVCLNKSGMKGGGSVQITFAWGLAVLLPAFMLTPHSRDSLSTTAPSLP
jgi:glycerol uptake facilitator-like aquaporin